MSRRITRFHPRSQDFLPVTEAGLADRIGRNRPGGRLCLE
jgi:hypothetical protein